MEWRDPEGAPRTRRDEWRDITGANRSPAVLKAEDERFSRDLARMYHTASVFSGNPTVGGALLFAGQAAAPVGERMTPLETAAIPVLGTVTSRALVPAGRGSRTAAEPTPGEIYRRGTTEALRKISEREAMRDAVYARRFERDMDLQYAADPHIVRRPTVSVGETPAPAPKTLWGRFKKMSAPVVAGAGKVLTKRNMMRAAGITGAVNVAGAGIKAALDLHDKNQASVKNAVDLNRRISGVRALRDLASDPAFGSDETLGKAMATPEAFAEHQRKFVDALALQYVNAATAATASEMRAEAEDALSAMQQQYRKHNAPAERYYRELAEVLGFPDAARTRLRTAMDKFDAELNSRKGGL